MAEENGEGRQCGGSSSIASEGFRREIREEGVGEWDTAKRNVKPAHPQKTGMGDRYLLVILLLHLLLCGTWSFCDKAPAWKLRARQTAVRMKDQRDRDVPGPAPLQTLQRALTNNPLARVFVNTYTFFYWLPKRNMPYDNPWQLFKNSSVEWIAWYQFPHNLPPYRYLDSTGFAEGYRDDFFCYGLPGNTLPLGNWDPAGFQLVHKRVLLKYRESEIKHGRLAMLSTLGFTVQESHHPLFPDVGGMAITHMEQLRALPPPTTGLLGGFTFLADAIGGQSSTDVAAYVGSLSMPLNYIAVCAFLTAFEIAALRRNWTRWGNAEYKHQYDQNIGIGNLKTTYENGDYGFDPLRLQPTEANERRDMQEKELNHGRLAMIAAIGMIGQEYLTGLPIRTSIELWLQSPLAEPSLPSLSSLDILLNLPESASQSLRILQQENLGGLPP